MSHGSQQLRRFRIAIRDGATVEDAAAASGMGINEARSWAKDDAEFPPPAEAYELIGEQPVRSRVSVTLGDCVEVLRARTGPLFDAVICDPPYHLGTRSAEIGHPSWNASTQASREAAKRGFMGKEWDGGDVAFRPDTWRAVFDQMKPGAHLAAFSGTRTYHRMAVAIEDAGFEVRDQLAWIYGSGMPKSSGLKPAWEPICLARKPCEGTRKANIAAHGTGGLNIEACRVPHGEVLREGAGIFPMRHDAAVPRGRSGEPSADRRYQHEGATDFATTPGPRGGDASGRWPANILHDDSDEVLTGFPVTASTPPGNIKPSAATEHVFGEYRSRSLVGHTDSGSAARFFYSAKAGPLDRLGSEHPTVKPVDLMRWLVRLITPPGGLILDPFAGSGTTGIAAIAEGFSAELIDLEADHVADIETKLAHLRGEGARIVERHLKRKAERAKPTAGTLFD